MDDLGIQMRQMQVDMILAGADAAALADFDGHGARDHVARGQVLGRGRVALHEALAFGIDQIAAFAARAFGDQAAGAVDAGRMELHEFHVLQRQAGAQHHGIAVAGLGVGAGAALIGAAITAGGHDHLVGAEAVDGAVVEIPGHHAAAGAVFHDQVEGEIFDEEIDFMLHALAVEGVQHGMAGAVGRRAGALHDALAVIGGHAAKGALVDLAFLGAAEGHAEMLQLVDRFGRIAAEIFNGILIAQPVRTLDGVVHMPAPIILAHIAQARRDAALRRHGVAAGGKHLGDAGCLQTACGAFQGGAQTGAAGADNHDVESMVNDIVGGHECSYRAAMRTMANRQVAPVAMTEKRISRSRNILAPAVWT